MDVISCERRVVVVAKIGVAERIVIMGVMVGLYANVLQASRGKQRIGVPDPRHQKREHQR
ncbi:hypothetical protein [Metapseudomonas otitidis]|uniref:hypothetical protein n=1 Tax=Metapseudomonas otitidis TaxID=319939 RepID=UPI00209B0E29|nr:hypothetical protein [Pseudomonas otitidis]MCO7556861.1 hypothetical protein [Pseudomonas otitidis]